MRLHRVKLCNYRGVAGCEVEFPTQGITVIEGPNEVGKTSIPEGLDLVLTKKDSSEHRQVKSTQPVGRDVGPEVEIEMSTGEYRFVYRKRWLRRSETVLNVLLPRRDKLTGRLQPMSEWKKSSMRPLTESCGERCESNRALSFPCRASMCRRWLGPSTRPRAEMTHPTKTTTYGPGSAKSATSTGL